MKSRAGLNYLNLNAALFPVLDLNERPSARKRTPNHNFLSMLLELALVLGAVLLIAYVYLPRQYYLPISFLIIVVIGFASFFILDKKVLI